MSSLKDALGKPGEGVHAPRLGPYAAVDLLATLVFAEVVRRKWHPTQSYWAVAGGMITIGVVVHAFFGVQTALNKQLFLR